MAGNSTLTVSNDVDAPDVVLGTANDDVIALALGTSTLTVDGTSLDAAAMVDGSVTITGGTIAIKAGFRHRDRLSTVTPFLPCPTLMMVHTSYPTLL